MEVSWQHKNNKTNLILFCNGWGMDSTPFEHLASNEYDVCLLHNYSVLPEIFDVETLTAGYAEVILIGWSMGVWAGQKLFKNTSHLFDRIIAINGTLCPINDDYGIPVKVYDRTLSDYGEAARLKFYRRMCREKTNLKLFLSKQPQRSLDDQQQELLALKKMVHCLPASESIYKEILIADSDWVIPSQNQINFWQGMAVTQISGFHYLFSLWQSWDHLLCYSDYAL
jgi:biotin synthesis protein BioG